MRVKLGRSVVLVTAVALLFGFGATMDAQDGPPDSQQPMEIPPQYQGGPQTPAPQGSVQQVAQNENGAGRISFIHGDVSTQHDGATEWTTATINTPVVPGDHISTGPNSRAEIQLDYANILRLSDQTTANVVSLSRNQIQLQMGQGLAMYDVVRNSDANIEIDTPNVAVRPGKGEGSFRVLVNSDGQTIVDVRNGSAEISTPQGSTRVERDQRITIQGSADNAQYQISGAPGRDDWDRWNADRDRAIEGAQSWKNTNPYYTGTQDLDANGQWRDVPDYGQVWFPTAGPDWAPYRDGRWVYEPYYGWTWVSYEPWGWAPYHYGRWFTYGGAWGWWPGPIYAGYYPLWAPAYVSFFGFGGGGWGVGFGFGFGGGFGRVGWLPCGPGDRFFPWYGRGIGRVNVVNVYNIHNERGGLDPLRRGPGAFSNVERASSDARVRTGFSSMESNQFGRGRVPMQQSRMEASTFRQSSLMTGANPVSPSRESYQSTERAANPRSIPSRSVTSQHFFSSNNARSNVGVQGGAGFNRGPNSAGNPAQSNARGFSSAAPANSPTVNRGAREPIQSSRPGWQTFTPPSGSSSSGRPGQTYNGGRTYESQGTPQARSNSNPYGSGRPTLDMHQPVVTPRGGAPNMSRAPSPAYRGYSAPPARGGYPGNSGGSYHPAPQSGGARGGSSGAPRGGNSRGGGSRGGNSGGGHSHR